MMSQINTHCDLCLSTNEDAFMITGWPLIISSTSPNELLQATSPRKEQRAQCQKAGLTSPSAGHSEERPLPLRTTCLSMLNKLMTHDSNPTHVESPTSWFAVIPRQLSFLNQINIVCHSWSEDVNGEILTENEIYVLKTSYFGGFQPTLIIMSDVISA